MCSYTLEFFSHQQSGYNSWLSLFCVFVVAVFCRCSSLLVSCGKSEIVTSTSSSIGCVLCEMKSCKQALFWGITHQRRSCERAESFTAPSLVRETQKEGLLAGYCLRGSSVPCERARDAEVWGARGSTEVEIGCKGIEEMNRM